MSSQHNLSGTAHPAMNAASGLGAQLGPLTAQNPLLVSTGNHSSQWAKAKLTTNKTIFSARIEVVQVNNGYIVQIGMQEGYEYDSYIAGDIKEVNDILTAQMVAMKLEG